MRCFLLDFWSQSSTNRATRSAQNYLFSYSGTFFFGHPKPFPSSPERRVLKHLLWATTFEDQTISFAHRLFIGPYNLTLLLDSEASISWFFTTKEGGLWGGLYSSYIANCVFNGLLSFTAVMVNSVTIHAIRKTSSWQKPLKSLLLSLSVSDLGVGLLIQPLDIAVRVFELEQNTENNSTYKAMYIVDLTPLKLFFLASFFGVMALSLDRFLAFHLHLRYQELVTHKRVVFGVISIWVFSAILSLVRLWTSVNIMFVIFAVIEVSCVIFTGFLLLQQYGTTQIKCMPFKFNK